MINKERTNKSAEAVNQIRCLIREDYSKNKDLFDENDYERVLNDDWYVKRFLLIKKRKVDAGYKALKDALIWRKEMNLNQIKDYHFPCELYTSGFLFVYENDKENHPVVYLRVCKYRKMPEMESILRKFIIHMLDKLDRLTNGNGIGMVFDLSGAQASNVDWSFLKYFTDSGTNYFPYSIKYVLIYNLPWYLAAIQKVALSVLPAENMGIIKFAKGSGITGFIDEECLPDFLGGSCARNYRASPKGAPSLEKILRDEEKLPENVIDKIVSIFKEMEIPDKGTEDKVYIEPTNFFDSLEETNEFNDADYTLESDKTWLITEPQESLLFTDNIDRNQLTSQLVLQNICDKVIAFKILSNNSVNYRLSPCYGLILPNSSLTVSLTRLIGLSDIIKRSSIDKISIKSLPVPKESMSGSEFYNLWKNQVDHVATNRLTCRIHFTPSYSQPSPKMLMNVSSIDDVTSVDLENQVQLLKKKYKNIEIQQNKTSLIVTIAIVFFAIIFSYFLAAYSDLQPIRYLRNNSTTTSTSLSSDA